MKPLERSPEYYFYLGDTYKKQGMLDQAIEYFEKSLMLNPRSPHTLHNLGNALREKGDFDRAVRSYEAALAIEMGAEVADIGTLAARLNASGFGRDDAGVGILSSPYTDPGPDGGPPASRP